MEYLHVINIEKHNPNYKDRQNIWLRYHFSANNDHQFSRLCEIDKWRFIEFIRLEIQTKSPVPIDKTYLKRQGFDLQKRNLTSTINQLTASRLVDNGSMTELRQRHDSLTTESQQEPKIVTAKGLKKKSVTQSRVEKSRVEKKKHIAKMIPPTLEELSQYIHEKRYQISAQAFFDKYENENPPWTNNKGKPMTSWKSTLVTWNDNAQKNNKQAIDNNRDENGVCY